MSDEIVAILRLELTDSRNEIIRVAEQCDKWAVESRMWGWSTHQVDANIRIAHELRLQAAHISNTLERSNPAAPGGGK